MFVGIFYKPIMDISNEEKIIQNVMIMGGGSENGWYNRHIGKLYEIYK